MAIRKNAKKIAAQTMSVPRAQTQLGVCRIARIFAQLHDGRVIPAG